jgi:hypothetical protein
MLGRVASVTRVPTLLVANIALPAYTRHSKAAPILKLLTLLAYIAKDYCKHTI